MKKNNYSQRSSVKFFFALMIILSAFLPAKAFVSGYTFSSSTTNYTAITGTTLFTGTWDDGVSTLLTIPFTFTYNGTAYTSLGVCTNGFITMGSVPASSTVYCGLQAAGLNSIAGYGTDLVNASATSTIIYGSRGTAPNRQFVIQWTDCDHYNNASANHWTFQIILNETSNTVQVVWGPTTDATTTGANTCADVSTESGNIGLLGGSASDFNIRSVTNGTNTWATSIAGAALTAVCNMSSTNFPAAGLTYTWTPGAVLPMSYTSSTTIYLNNGAAVSRNTTGNQILQVQVVTSGTTTPLNLTSVTLSTAGCTNPATDITNAKVYYTGISNTFSSATQFGATANNPNGTYTVTGSVSLSEGINYFWITYDITANAGFGDILSGCCTQLIGSGTMGARTPTVTCPAGTQTISQIGTWTPVATLAPHPSGGGMLLLSDGTVLCKSTGGGADGYGNIYDKLTPNANGSYVNGTWSSIAPMISTRLFYSSQILKDGRVYVAGGEYGAGLAKGEVYNPLTNTWTATANNPSGNVSDANSEILEDGRVLQALVAGSLTGTNIYTPSTNSYTTGPTAFGIHNESAWLKLPDNSVLYVDRLSTSSERYIPATNTWVQDAALPVSLYDPFGDETGGALLLPDGRAFFLGALGHTAYYTPSGTTSPGVWNAGPDIPGAQGTPDAPMAMMANGKIICTVSPIPTSANHFPSPTKFYEFDYLTNTFTQIGVPGGGTSLPISCYITNFVDLPDGTVLYSIQQNAGASQYYVYTPVGNPVASGKPTISAIKQTTCTTFKAFGTKFNGISQGASYGDDWQMSSNYPIVRLTSGANVYYARTANWNSTGVMRGNLPDSVQFTTPAGLPAGTYSLVVVANGISSDPVSFTPTPSLSSTLTPAAICSGNAFTYTPTSTTSGVTFTWTRAAVAGISNAAITTPQSTNPNEVLINTTGSPVSVVYTYTIIGGTCSNTQSVTVVVNPASGTAATITAGGPTTFCSGGSVLLSGNTNAGTWSIGGGTTQTLLAIASGDYYVTNASACGVLISNHITVTVNPNPTASVITAGGPTTFCQSGNVLLSGNSTGGTWSIGGGTTATLTATTAGDYFTTTSNSCGSVQSNHITVTVNPNPTASVISAGGPTTFCSGGNVLLSGNSTGGTWSVGGGTTSTLTATTAGDYFVTTTNSCGSTTSNHITVTVNSLPTASVISAGGPTTFCSGGNVLLSGNSTGGTWSVGGGTTATLTATIAGDYFVTTTNSCGSTTSNHITVTVNPNPTASVISAGGPTTFCSGGNVLLSGNSTSGIWSVGGGTTATLTASTTGDYFVTTTNSCGNTTSNHITVTVNPNPTPSVITAGGPTSFCSGGNVLLSGNSTSGIWSVAGGTTATLAASTTGDYFTTTSNSCGSVESNHITVTVNPNPTPSVITAGGPTTFCSGGNILLSGNSTGGTWSIGGGTTATLTATTSGDYFTTTSNSCGSVESNHITVTVNPLSVVSFSGLASSYNVTAAAATLTGSPSGGTFSGPGISGNTFTPATAGAGGPYTITYLYTNANGCSNSSSQQTTVVSCTLPGRPGTITATGGNTKVCPGDSKTYSIVAISGATSYTWTPPTGGVVTSGQGTVTVVVSYTATFTASGTLSVVSNNACGTSTSRTLTITRNTPATPSTITGLSAGVCGSSGVPYSVTNVAGITYNWTFSVANASIASGQGLNGVTANFLPAYSTGQIRVTAGNACGISAQRTLTINAISSIPASITGSATACANQFGVPYSTVAVAGAVSYTWTCPTGGHISDGVTTSASTTLTTTATSVTVNFGGSTGNVRVRSNNACGSSSYRTKAITFNCRLDGSEMETNFSVYPNPTDGAFVVEISNPENFTTLKIENILGQTILTKNINGESTLNIQFPNEVSKGVYMIRLIGENAIDSKQIVLQ